MNTNLIKMDNVAAQYFYIMKIIKGLMVFTVFALFIYGGMMILLNPNTLPIKQVMIKGDFTHLSPKHLRLLVNDKVRGNFFNLDVDAVRLALLNEPWVHQVIVKRIWPDTLRVMVTEQVPVVRWGTKGLLSTSGKYFEPSGSTIPENLPMLTGPVGSQTNVLSRFNTIHEKISKVGFDIAALRLDERRAWTLVLTNGSVVIFGRSNFEQRFNRFLSLITPILLERVEPAKSIDMRYTNGFSIQWKQIP